jgi:hypothetical protein
MLVERDDGQVFTLRRSSKTKFLHGDDPVKPDEVYADAIVSVDASEDNELKLLAKVVRIEKNGPKPALIQR